MNLNKKQKELLMYCVLAFVGGYLMCMYYPVHRRTNGVNFQLPPVLEGMGHRQEGGEEEVNEPGSVQDHESHNSPP